MAFETLFLAAFLGTIAAKIFVFGFGSLAALILGTICEKKE